MALKKTMKIISKLLPHRFPFSSKEGGDKKNAWTNLNSILSAQRTGFFETISPD